jgi:2-keto-3-deoxy-6-phosphogluconate aldolase
MKKYSSEIIKRDKLIVILKGVGRYEILRTGAELFKADVPACLVEFKDNKKQVAADMLLLSDRFGSDIIIGAKNISDPKELRLAFRNGAKLVWLDSDNEKLILKAKKKGLIVIAKAETEEEALKKTELGADIIYSTVVFKNPRLENSVFLFAEDFEKADSLINDGAGGIIMHSPIVTPEILASKNWPEVKEKAEEALKIINK